MRLLLDTHTFLWYINGSPKLSKYSRTLIDKKSNTRFLSVASLWEISIKASIGKLKLSMSFSELVVEQVYGNAIELVNITPRHLEILYTMTYHHRDPFDRLIICQSMCENMPVLSKDKSFDRYPIKRIWSKKK